LPAAADLGATPQRLSVDVARLRVQPLKSIAIDASDGLSPLEVAVLAVLNSPDLAAKRRQAKVSEAQVFAAGLLPDPQLALSVDKPVAGPDTHTAKAANLSLDLAGMLATLNAHRAAKATARQADLDVLWAEWTDAQQARQLAETVLADEGRAAVLRRVVALAQDRYVRSTRALANRDVTLQTNAADLAVKADAEPSCSPPSTMRPRRAATSTPCWAAGRRDPAAGPGPALDRL